MTASYRPSDPAYFDRGDLDGELQRAFDICQGCRLCFNLCPSFPSLFDAVDSHDGDVSALTAGERDEVVDQCFGCKRCATKCPYVPPHEWALDFPRLMLRAKAQRKGGLRDRITDQALGRTDLSGYLGVVTAPLSVARPGGLGRRFAERTLGITADRILPPVARQRFSTWFRRRPPRAEPDVSVFATCLVEYHEPDIGKAAVGLLERRGVGCDVPEGTRCCGAPWLHGGNLRLFLRQASRNLEALLPSIRAGRPILVAQPTCSYVLKRDYPMYLEDDDAARLADLVVDPAEYLLSSGDVEKVEVPARVTYHVACHQEARQVGLKSRDLLRAAGIGCDLVQRCSGIDGGWGLRAANRELSSKVAQPMLSEIEAADNAIVCGECALANGVVEEATGIRPRHPLEVLARAYGLA